MKLETIEVFMMQSIFFIISFYRMGNKIMLVSQESHRMVQQSNLLMVSIKYYVLTDTKNQRLEYLLVITQATLPVKVQI
jgi:hypothetical protein